MCVCLFILFSPILLHISLCLVGRLPFTRLRFLSHSMYLSSSPLLTRSGVFFSQVISNAISSFVKFLYFRGFLCTRVSIVSLQVYIGLNSSL